MSNRQRMLEYENAMLPNCGKVVAALHRHHSYFELKLKKSGVLHTIDIASICRREPDPGYQKQCSDQVLGWPCRGFDGFHGSKVNK
jgi:hypothetical protein